MRAGLHRGGVRLVHRPASVLESLVACLSALKAAGLAVSLAVLLALHGAGCAQGPRPAGRVLVIAVDGASKRLVHELMATGDLPHLSALAREGASGVSRSSLPILSPRIWTSVATGKLPEQHGIEGWIWLGEDGAPRLFSSRDRTTHAIWNILTDAGLSSGVVNWLMTHPPERIKGVMVSDHAAEGVADDKVELAQTFAANLSGAKGPVQVDSPDASFVHPDDWSERLREARRAPDLTSIPDPFGDPQEWVDHPITDFLRTTYANDQFSAQVALQVDAEIEPDLLLVYLPGIDRVSHFLWDSVEPRENIPEALRRPPEIRARHARALRAYYSFVDQLIGRLTEGRAPSDLVFVLSDHGFEIDPTRDNLEGVHESPAAQDGILFMRGRGVPAGRDDLVIQTTDIAPTILAWLGLAPAKDMAGRPAPFMEMEIPAAIATYDTSRIEYVGGNRPEVESRILENLRGLGYVE